jgi:hypothetical protein
MRLIKKTNFEAFVLYQLAFHPNLDLKESIKISIDREGWKSDYPANLILSKGTYPKVDGRHRLSYLKQINKLHLLIPTYIYLI